MFALGERRGDATVFALVLGLLVLVGVALSLVSWRPTTAYSARGVLVSGFEESSFTPEGATERM